MSKQHRSMPIGHNQLRLLVVLSITSYTSWWFCYAGAYRLHPKRGVYRRIPLFENRLKPTKSLMAKPVQQNGLVA